jgi:ferric-dicitrate binding protein FerR (iron transport regulator)
MTACRRMRDAIVAVVRGQASEADRLRLELHLGECGSCRAEKARWLLVAHLQEQEPQRLSPDARARVLRHLTNLPEPEVVGIEKARRLLPLFYGAAATVAIAVALLVVLRSRHDPALGRAGMPHDNRPQQTSVPGERAIAVRAQTAGAIDSGGAHIIYGAHAEFRVLPGGRQVELYAGDIDVEVAPGGPGRFRVLAPRFTVEVLGTHFVVGLDRVVTLHGLVRVVEPAAGGAREDTQLALVHEGQTWRLPEAHALAELNPSDPVGATSAPRLAAQPIPGLPSAGSPAPSQDDRNDSLRRGGSMSGADFPAMAERPAAGPQIPASRHVAENDQGAPGARVANVARVATVDGRTGIGTGMGAMNAPPPSVERLLADARTALASGNTRRARASVAAALVAKPKARQRAIAELLSADTLLVESRYAAALAAYRRTMDAFGKYPEGETAAFALAQLLSERGPQEQARKALRRYLARYPAGRFAEEVEKKLDSTAAP